MIHVTVVGWPSVKHTDAQKPTCLYRAPSGFTTTTRQTHPPVTSITTANKFPSTTTTISPPQFPAFRIIYVVPSGLTTTRQNYPLVTTIATTNNKHFHSAEYVHV